MQLINRLATALHRMPSEIRAMPFDEARSLTAYWEQWPPAHESLTMLLAAQTSWKPPEKSAPDKPRVSTAEDLAQFAALVGVPINRKP